MCFPRTKEICTVDDSSLLKPSEWLTEGQFILVGVRREGSKDEYEDEEYVGVIQLGTESRYRVISHGMHKM